MTGARIAVLVLLVVMAGCQTSYAENPFWTGDRDNPWREAELTVVLETPADDDSDYQSIAREAFDFWETESDRYAGYPIAFRIVPEAADPDMVVAFVPDVFECGDHEHTAGCAPVLKSPAQVERPVRVRIKTGFSRESTLRVLKHELGHSLGLTHSDEPQSVMAAQSALTTGPQPDATERALPWDDPELSVYVEDPGGSDAHREEIERQIQGALGYFDRGAEGTVPDNVTFVRTEDRTAADVVIRFGATEGCTESPGSCGSLSGLDPDGDGELETYTKLRITVVDIDAEAVGWHVGHWLGTGFGFDEPSDYPPPLRDATYEERRSDWWTTG